MGMGIVSDTEFESQLSNVSHSSSKKSNDETPSELSESIEGEIVDIPNRGRKEGDNNVPDSLRNLIGATAATEGRQEALALAKMFDVSPSSASAYGNGATSTASYHNPDPKIKDVIFGQKSRLTKRALNKLGRSLSKITDDKLELLDAKELAAVSKDMSAIVKNMEPEANKSDDGKPNVAFVIYTPPIRTIDSFDSVQVPE